MKHKTSSTKPFPYAYRIWDTVDKIYVYETISRRIVYQTFHNFYNEWITHTIRHYSSYTYTWYEREEQDYRRYQILNHFNEVISYNDLHELYGARRINYWIRHQRRAKKSPDIRYKSGNPNKIKRGYYTGYWFEDDNKYEADFITGGYFRSFYTMNERRQNAAHVDDYGIEVVRGRRRGRNLPDSWDDYKNSSWGSVKSWKHHSKRRHQYKIK